MLPLWVMKLTYLYVASILAICLSGCDRKQQLVDENTLYVSILPLRSIIENIVGQDFNIQVLVPAGASPELFEPTPKQYIAANRAKLLFNTGLLDFEDKIISKISDKKRVVSLQHGINLISGSCSHGCKSHNSNHGIDPHIWTSAQNLQIIATNAYDAIHRLYPDSIHYKKNYNTLISKLQALDGYIANRIKKSELPYFIIYHPALTYYARDYGIEQISVENEGKEPSAKRLSNIIGQAREDGIKYIFYQSQFPKSSIEIIAKDIDGECVEINPLEEDVISNLKVITNLITR